jgi:hypothetical protein
VEPSGTQHSGQIKEDKHLVDLHLDARETRETLPLFNDIDKQAPTQPSATHLHRSRQRQAHQRPTSQHSQLSPQGSRSVQHPRHRAPRLRPRGPDRANTRLDQACQVGRRRTPCSHARGPGRRLPSPACRTRHDQECRHCAPIGASPLCGECSPGRCAS